MGNHILTRLSKVLLNNSFQHSERRDWSGKQTFSKAPADLSNCGGPGEFVPSSWAPPHPVPTHTAQQSPGGTDAAL